MIHRSKGHFFHAYKKHDVGPRKTGKSDRGVIFYR